MTARSHNILLVNLKGGRSRSIDHDGGSSSIDYPNRLSDTLGTSLLFSRLLSSVSTSHSP